MMVWVATLEVTVTVTGVDVEVGYAPLLVKIAVTEFAPGCSVEPLTEAEQELPDSVQLPTVTPAAEKAIEPARAGAVPV